MHRHELYERLLQEVTEARLSRRELLKMGLATGLGMVGLRAYRVFAAGGKDGRLTSPPTRPWVVDLPIPPVKQPVPVGALGPAPRVEPNTAAGEARTRAHQALLRYPPREYYLVRQQERPHSFHPDLPDNPIWGYDGQFPGPSFHLHYGSAALVRTFNELPALDRHVGFGLPSTSSHMHNGHTPSESDGQPGDFQDPGSFYDRHYPNIYAGDDVREAQGTQWIHDHRVDFTAQNVYKGLAQFCLLFDELDTGSETDPPPAFGLPSGEFDIPLIIADRQFDGQGRLVFDVFDLDGGLGDKETVNGKIQPVLRVANRKYRFRILDGATARWYELFLQYGSSGRNEPFTLIANDGNLLPHPVPLTSLRLSPAERFDVVVDFSKYKKGDVLYLVNRLEQTDGRRPSGNLLRPGTALLKIEVDREIRPGVDPSRVPAELRELPPSPLTDPGIRVARTRTWRFDRSQGVWTVNGKLFDLDDVRATPRRDTAEIWVFQNNSGGWAHPIHVHFEEFQILSRNGRRPPAHEIARKDVVQLNRNEEVKIFMHFRDFEDRYVMHCHNTVHEDHAMMIRFDVVA